MNSTILVALLLCAQNLMAMQLYFTGPTQAEIHHLKLKDSQDLDSVLLNYFRQANLIEPGFKQHAPSLVREFREVLTQKWTQDKIDVQKVAVLFLDITSSGIRTKVLKKGGSKVLVEHHTELSEHHARWIRQYAQNGENVLKLARKVENIKNINFSNRRTTRRELAGEVVSYQVKIGSQEIIQEFPVNLAYFLIGNGPNTDLKLPEEFSSDVRISLPGNKKDVQSRNMKITSVQSIIINNKTYNSKEGSIILPFSENKSYVLQIGQQTITLQKKREVRRTRKSKIQRFFTISGATLGLGSIGSYFSTIHYLKNIRSNKFTHPNFQLAGLNGPFIIKASDGTRVNEYDPPSPEIPFDQIDEKIIALLILSEDENFWKHEGFDPLSIASAAVRNVIAGKTLSGASTITQQLARSLDTENVGNAKTFWRKIDEISFAMYLEKVLTKEEILARYAQIVKTGYPSGLESFANLYGRSIYDSFGISWLDAARLIVALPAPSKFRPETQINRDRALRLLTKAHTKGVISDQEMAEIGTELQARPFLFPNPLVARSKLGPYADAQIWADMNSIREQSTDENPIDFERGFITVESSHDDELQKGVQDIVTQFVQKTANVGQGAVTIADAKTGKILVTVGGIDPETDKNPRQDYNHLQMASTFKILGYLSYLLKNPNLSESSLRYLEDNFARSDNTVANSVVQRAGPKFVAETSVKLGLSPESVLVAEHENEKEPYKYPGFYLGQDGASVNQMAQVAATLYNQGKLVEISSIDRIYNTRGCDPYEPQECGQVIASRKTSEEQPQVISQSAAERMMRFMNAASRYGTSSKLSRQSFSNKYTLGFKTGTSDKGKSLRLTGIMEPKEGKSDKNAVVISIWLGNDLFTPTYNSSALAVDLAVKLTRYLDSYYFND